MLPRLSINLFSSKKSKQHFEIFSAAMLVNPCCSISQLFLSNNEVTDAGFLQLAMCIYQKDRCRHQTNIRILDLSENFLGDESAKALAHVLIANKSLVTIDLMSNCISDAGVDEIIRALENNNNNNTLEKILLERNRATSDKISVLYQLVQQQQIKGATACKPQFVQKQGAPRRLSQRSSASKEPLRGVRVEEMRREGGGGGGSEACGPHESSGLAEQF